MDNTCCDTSAADGADFNILTDGTYFVRVTPFSATDIGTYDLMVTTCGRAAAFPLATVSGRVLTPAGLGLRNATVSLTDSQGVRRTAVTTSFGFYSFDNVRTGASYTIAVSSKRFRFAPQTVPVNGNLTLADFVGLE